MFGFFAGLRVGEGPQRKGKGKGKGNGNGRVVADGMLRSHPSQKREGWGTRGFVAGERNFVFGLFGSQGFNGFDLGGSAAGEGCCGDCGYDEEEDYGQHHGEVSG